MICHIIVISAAKDDNDIMKKEIKEKDEQLEKIKKKLSLLLLESYEKGYSNSNCY